MSFCCILTFEVIDTPAVSLCFRLFCSAKNTVSYSVSRDESVIKVFIYHLKKILKNERLLKNIRILLT